MKNLGLMIYHFQQSHFTGKSLTSFSQVTAVQCDFYPFVHTTLKISILAIVFPVNSENSKPQVNTVDGWRQAAGNASLIISSSPNKQKSLFTTVYWTSTLL